MNHTYHQIQSGLEIIKYFKSIIKMCDEDRAKMFSSAYGYHYVNYNRVAENNPHISKGQVRAMVSAAGQILGDTQILRDELSERTDYMFIQNMVKKSTSAFYSAIISYLELESLSCSVAAIGGPYDLISGEVRRGRWDNDITIPCHWYKTVYDRGLHVVNANDGPRVVISATRKKVGRLNDMNIQVFKGQAMGFKKRLRKYWLHDAWIMKMEAEDNVITALHEDFTKAEQLINRRIRKAVTEALNV